MAASASSASDAGGEIVYKSYPSRFAVLGLFSLANCENAVLWLTFANIFQAAQDYWGVSAAAINWLSLVFLILFIPGSLGATYLTHRFGLRTSLIVGSTMNAVGAWIRYAGVMAGEGSSAGFAAVMVGQCIAALAQPVFVNAPSLVSSQWFTVKERDVATVASALSNVVGNGVGSVVPPLVVTAPGDIPGLLLGCAIACTATAVAIVFLPARPPTPPSKAAALRRKAEAAAFGESDVGLLAVAEDIATPTPTPRPGKALDEEHDSVAQALLESEARAAPAGGGAWAGAEHAVRHHSASDALRAMMADYGTLLRNRNFLPLAVGFGVGLGMFNALMTLLSQLWQPCSDYTDSDPSSPNYYGNDNTPAESGAALLGAGLVSAFVVGVALEKTHAYVPFLRGGIAIALGACLFFLSSLRKGAGGVLIASCGVMGAALIPLLPISLENCAECTYPLSEDAGAGLMLSVGQIVGIAAIFTLQALMGDASVADCSTVITPTAGCIVAVFAIAGIAIACFRKDYRRQAAEAAKGRRHHRAAGSDVEAAALPAAS